MRQEKTTCTSASLGIILLSKQRKQVEIWGEKSPPTAVAPTIGFLWLKKQIQVEIWGGIGTPAAAALSLRFSQAEIEKWLGDAAKKAHLKLLLPRQGFCCQKAEKVEVWGRKDVCTCCSYSTFCSEPNLYNLINILGRLLLPRYGFATSPLSCNLQARLSPPSLAATYMLYIYTAPPSSLAIDPRAKLQPTQCAIRPPRFQASYWHLCQIATRSICIYTAANVEIQAKRQPARLWVYTAPPPSQAVDLWAKLRSTQFIFTPLMSSSTLINSPSPPSYSSITDPTITSPLPNPPPLSGLISLHNSASQTAVNSSSLALFTSHLLLPYHIPLFLDLSFFTL